MHTRVLACVPTIMLIRHRLCMSRIHHSLLRATVHLRAAYNQQGMQSTPTIYIVLACMFIQFFVYFIEYVHLLHLSTAMEEDRL